MYLFHYLIGDKSLGILTTVVTIFMKYKVPKSNMSLSVTRKRNVVLSVDIIVNLILAQECLVQMQEGSDPNLRPEATWFMKIGECR